MRDYDPTTGRYLQPDPLGLIDGASVYGYAGQSPMMNMDPTGECFGPAAVWCARAGWFGFFLLIDYLQDEDCYTWDDFAEFAKWYAIPGRAGLLLRLGNRAGGGGGGGGNPKPEPGTSVPPKGPDPTPSPALKGSPYHPAAVESRVRPPYKPNPAHNPTKPQYNPHKTPEPPDAATAYQRALRGDNSQTFYAKGEQGWYQYHSDNTGSVHFAGTVPESSVPNYIRKSQ